MKPVNLFLLTVIVCIGYVFTVFFNGREYDKVFWFALITAIFNFGLWVYMRKNERRENEA